MLRGFLSVFTFFHKVMKCRTGTEFLIHTPTNSKIMKQIKIKLSEVIDNKIMSGIGLTLLMVLIFLIVGSASLVMLINSPA